MISIILFIFFSFETIDTNCDSMRINESFAENVIIYRKWNEKDYNLFTNQYYDRYLIHKNGKEWELKLKIDSENRKINLTIDPNYSNVSNVVLKFSAIHKTFFGTSYHLYNCEVN